MPLGGLALPFTDGDVAKCVVTAAIAGLVEPYRNAVLSECCRVSRSPMRDGAHSLAVVSSSVAEEGTVPVFSQMTWFNEPSQSSIVDGSLHAVTKSKTDFWRKTFYGFTRDDGHFLYGDVSGDFTAEVTISGSYETPYDQSGLMLRVDEEQWLKAGVEYTDGAMHLSTVVTRGFSDWSMIPLTSYDGSVTLRLTRHDTALRVQYRNAQGTWQMLRLAYLDLPDTVQVGVMCCSPEREGFVAVFRDYAVGEPIARALHD